MKRLSLAVSVVALWGCLPILGCGESGSTDGSVPTRSSSGMAQQGGGSAQHAKSPATNYAVRPVHWKVFGPPMGRIVRISSIVGYCAGGVKPRIQSVRIREETEKVLLTAMLMIPSTGGEGCAGVGLGVRKTVRLKRSLGKRQLYDASVSPPQRRWPVG